MKSNIDSIIRKILRSEANEDEKAIFDTWISFPENEQVFLKLQEIWKNNSITKTKDDEELFERIWEQCTEVRTTKGNRQKHLALSYIIKIAASILILLIPSFFIGRFFFKTDVAFVTSVSPKRVIKENPEGQKMKVFLPDGSTVWLNSASAITYDDTFSDSVRLIELKGEAFFEVFKDDKKPFVVKTGDIVTTAIGTSFNIYAYPEEKTTEISLITGKIKVADKNNSFYLHPNTALAYNKWQESFIEFKLPTLDRIAWKDGVLIFDKYDFATVVKKLERWYGITISVEGEPPTDWDLTGRFTNDYLVEVLEVMKFSRSFEYTLNNKRLLLRF